MTNRRPCPPAPGPLEAYAANFDQVLRRLPLACTPCCPIWCRGGGLKAITAPRAARLRELITPLPGHPERQLTQERSP